jgi:hypothetical protein
VIGPWTQVEEGSILAQRPGFRARTSRSPVAGTFTSYESATGFGLITIPAEPVSVRAHLKGIVADLIPAYGAIVETPATLIRGIFGLGGEQHGVLKVAVTAEDEPVSPERIDARVTYAIVLGGSEVTAATLHHMIGLGARGVITGSMRSSELANFLGYSGSDAWRMGAAVNTSNGWDFPPPNVSTPVPVPPDFVLIVTEGFGSAPMSKRVFETLAAHDGQEITIDGTTRLRGGLARPEIIIPLSRTTAVRWLEESGPKLAVGSHVRLLSPYFLGQTAEVIGLPVGPRASQSGVVSPAADVQLSGGQRLRVPLVDIEVLE